MVDLLDRFKVRIVESPKELQFYFPYDHNPAWTRLKDEIKGLEGAKFHPSPTPHWRAKNSLRNKFVLDLLAGKNPYHIYRKPLEEVAPNRSCLYPHQREALNFLLTRKNCILAAEMGTGKTLVLIEAIEHVKPQGVWYVAPRFALHQIKILFKEWGAQIIPEFYSYNDLKKIVTDWQSGDRAPQMLIFDESPYLKTPSTQRSLCAMHLISGMRLDHEDPYTFLASGAPAPKSPKDWWMQCEIACPGYLKERDIFAFERRMALIEQREALTGGFYPKLVTWWDNADKCAKCGQLKEHANHELSFEEKMRQVSASLTDPLANIGQNITTMIHPFEPSQNEVAALAERLKGLVLVQFKKDCLELPEKVYRIVKLDISPATQRAANMITRTAGSAIEALTRLRELSDGFQYKNEPSGELAECPRCKGTCKITEGVEMVCPSCKDGKVEVYKRVAQRVPCPKDVALRELLEECGDRIVIFGGFTESIDRIIKVCLEEGWPVIRVDGTTRNLPNECWVSQEIEDHPLSAFQDKDKYERFAFVAHAATAKTSLTLTASNMLVYYSNTFNADDRIQSEDRIHRIGMDTNKGATIVDLIHLPSDMYVRENLRKKRVLQSITLGELQEFMNDDNMCN